MPICSTCNLDKPDRDFPWFERAEGVCKECKTFVCAKCKSNKVRVHFSCNQMAKEDARKCKACTGQSTAVLTCRSCDKSLPVCLFKKDSRTLGKEICNECRQERDYEDDYQGYTGEYVLHGEWDTLTGRDDGSGVERF